MERRLDFLGRISIPKEYRRVLGWGDGSRLNMMIDGDKVILTKNDVRCSMCGSLDEVKEVKCVRVCKSCIEEIKTSNFWEEA
ncbi:MAG: AbrB/MazE/SpoVT family DNA-binding domain-containing protein [Turicibacter sp.]|nr:AbrB/MazE/SpoVT family DNA-binding domain-containing protein [Turicibacter sp.]